MPTAVRQGHFTSELFTFLRQLRKNNRRDWFERNKPRYLEHVRDPMLRFIGDVAPRLHALSPRIVADPSPVGGSMFRIHRDVRFSKDKSPYKTWAAARFPIEGGKDVHTPGFYLGIGADEVHMGAGLWHPDGPTLERLRHAIAGDAAGWKRMKQGVGRTKRHVFSGDALSRPPRGWDADHPLIEDLKRKDIITMAAIDPGDVCRRDFAARFAKMCAETAPLVKWLCGTLRMRW